MARAPCDPMSDFQEQLQSGKKTNLHLCRSKIGLTCCATNSVCCHPESGSMTAALIIDFLAIKLHQIRPPTTSVRSIPTRAHPEPTSAPANPPWSFAALRHCSRPGWLFHAARLIPSTTPCSALARRIVAFFPRVDDSTPTWGQRPHTSPAGFRLGIAEIVLLCARWARGLYM